ncbi:MAG: hypothetical protein IPM16_20730 [Chloroflexi bacterium]|nr:hypothetical protein [Chloroflexota bacterium]
MSTVDHHLLELFHRLRPAAKKRVLALIDHEIAAERASSAEEVFDFTAWMDDVESIRNETRQMATVNVVELLRELRDGDDE